MIMTQAYYDIGIAAVLAIVLFALTIIINKLIGATGPLAIVKARGLKKHIYKGVPYESSEFPIGETRFRFNIEYYIFPLIFLVFDVLSIFLFLWVLTYQPALTLSNFVIITIIVFLTVGLFVALLRDGSSLLTPIYLTKERQELLERAAEGDDEAIEEFLRIEPLDVYKKEPAIKVRVSKGIGEKDPKKLLQVVEDENMKMLVDPDTGSSIIVTSIRNVLRKGLGWLFNWGVAKSPWIPHLGIKCCSIEVPYASGVSRFDMERFGIAPSAAPRQTDLLIINGPITKKFAARAKMLYDMMPEPKFVIAFGECAIVGGPFKGSYSLIEGVNKILPVDIYVPGCPPRPEAFLEVIIHFREMVDKRNLDLGISESTKAFEKELKEKVEKLLEEL